MRESGEPMECGIFDFYKVFSRAFGEEEDGAGGSSNGRWGMSPRPRHSAMNSRISIQFVRLLSEAIQLI